MSYIPTEGEDRVLGTAVDPELESIEQGEQPAEWVVTETPYLKQLKVSHRTRARAALRWRPRFLKALAMSCTWTDALRGARVAYNTVRLHQRSDPEFAAQIAEAQEYGTELLHSVCWQEAVEGHLEPIYYRGELVGHVRKYDSRLQIEMLRAHMPDKFKTPGCKTTINTSSTANNTISLGPEELAAIQQKRQESLRRMAAQRGDTLNGGSGAK